MPPKIKMAEIKTILKSVIEKLEDETMHQSFVSSHFILQLPFGNEKFQKYNFRILEIIFSSTTADLNHDFIKIIKFLSKNDKCYLLFVQPRLADLYQL